MMLLYSFSEHLQEVSFKGNSNFFFDLRWKEHYINIKDICTAVEIRLQSKVQKRIRFVQVWSWVGVMWYTNE